MLQPRAFAALVASTSVALVLGCGDDTGPGGAGGETSASGAGSSVGGATSQGGATSAGGASSGGAAPTGGSTSNGGAGGAGGGPVVLSPETVWETPIATPTIVRRISVAPDGTAYVLDAAGAVRRFSSGGVEDTNGWPVQLATPAICTSDPAFITGLIQCHDIAATDDGGVVTVEAAGFGWRTTKRAADASADWEAEYDSGLDDIPHTVAVDAQGRVVVAGNPGSNAGQGHLGECALIGYDAGGTFIDALETDLSASAPPQLFGYCSSLSLDAQGVAYVGGRGIDTNNMAGMTVRKVDTAGQIDPAWTDFDALGTAYAYWSLPGGQLAPLAGGGLFAILTDGAGASDPHSVVVALDSAGVAAPATSSATRRYGGLTTSQRAAIVSQASLNTDPIQVTWYDVQGTTLTEVGSGALTDATTYRVLYTATTGPGEDVWLAKASSSGWQLVRVTAVVQ